MPAQPYADHPMTPEQFKALKPGDKVWVRPVKEGIWATVHGKPDDYAMQVKVEFADKSLRFGTFCLGDIWEAPPLPTEAEVNPWQANVDAMLRKAPSVHSLVSTTDLVHDNVERLIELTPTSTRRNNLTAANIHLMAALAFLQDLDGLPVPPAPAVADGEKDVFRLTVGGPVAMSAYLSNTSAFNVHFIRQLQGALLKAAVTMEKDVAAQLKRWSDDRQVWNIPGRDIRVEHMTAHPLDDNEPAEYFDVAVAIGLIMQVDAHEIGSEGVEVMGRSFDLTELD